MRALEVDPLGLEPRMTVPKTGVLPLHHGSNPLFQSDAKISNETL
jgi:hypothetical protein